MAQASEVDHGTTEEGKADEGQPPPDQGQNQNEDPIFTEEILIASSWTLHYSPLRHKRAMEFHPKGVIGVGKNAWENSWRFIKPGVLMVMTESGDPDGTLHDKDCSIFNEAIYASDGKWYLAGGAHNLTQGDIKVAHEPPSSKWTNYSNIDMCGQGDAEIIHNWKSTHSIDALKRIVEEKGYSAFTVSAGQPSFGHAALKKFDFPLSPNHCKPISTCCKHPCTIYIYNPNAAMNDTDGYVTTKK